MMLELAWPAVVALVALLAHQRFGEWVKGVAMVQRSKANELEDLVRSQKASDYAMVEATSMAQGILDRVKRLEMLAPDRGR